MLNRIRSEQIKPGFRLPGALCNASGNVLFSAGTCLNEGQISQLGHRIHVLYGGHDWPDDAFEKTAIAEPASDRSDSEVPPRSEDDFIPGDVEQLKVQSLRVGMRVSRDLFDDEGVLLLSAGTEVTTRFLHLLRRRNLRIVHFAAPAAIGEDPTIGITAGRPARSERPHDIEPRVALERLWDRARGGLVRHLVASASLKEICASLQDDKIASSADVSGIIGEFANLLTIDSAVLVTIVSMQKTAGEYLFDHGINVALLSMTTAAQMGLTRAQILEIGLGAVFQDVGMLRVPESIRLAPRSLTTVERVEIERHPTYTCDYLKRLTAVPESASDIAYQAHERCDGSGYPSGRRGTGLHRYARIVAVADVYSAMTRPRPYRPAVLPHDAVRELLTGCRKGKYDRATTRAFLDRMSAFPIGSRVELNDSTTGVVVRANPKLHTRPVIAEIGAGGERLDRILDLAKQPDLRVTRPLGLADEPGSRLYDFGPPNSG